MLAHYYAEQNGLGARLVKFLHAVHCSSFATNVMQLHFHNGGVYSAKPRDCYEYMLAM